MRALISVYEKKGISEFVQFLISQGYEIVSTGGTLKHLRDQEISVENISKITGFPEILGGRVKTLHPNIYAGILSVEQNKEHCNELERLELKRINLVVNNLYPFEEVAQNKDSTIEDVLDNIDIGGPSMIRAAAKNFPDVIVVVDPGDYSFVSELILKNLMSLDQRKMLAYKAFEYVSKYDYSISQYFSNLSNKSKNSNSIPAGINLNLQKSRQRH